MDNMIRDLAAIGYLDEELDPTQEAIEWYFDVCDGRLDLADEQHAMFHYLRDKAGSGQLFGSQQAAFMFHYQRTTLHFHGWCDDLDADQ